LKKVAGEKMAIKFKLISTKSDWNIARTLVEQNHSYVPNLNTIGRHIDFLIEDENGFLGFVGIGSATYPPCKDVLNFLNCTKEDYKSIFNNLANNWRFCLVRKVPNIGTQVLKLFREYSKFYWKEKYGDELRYIITFVGAGHDGAIYKADNWKLVVKTSGLKKHKSFSMKWNKTELN
jgi:hypothetical protein